MPPRKRVRSQSPDPDGQAPKKTRRAMGKTSTNTKSNKATAAKPPAQAGTSAVSKSNDGLNAGAKASARKPAGRQAAGSRPSARGRKKATGKVHADMGEQGNFQPVTVSREKERKNAKTSGAEADPDNDATEAKDSGPATATKTGDNIEVALGPSNGKEDTTDSPSPTGLRPAVAASHAGGAPIQGRASESITSANPSDAVTGAPAPVISHDTRAAGGELTITAARPSTPTDGRGPRSAGLRLGGDGGPSSCDSENTGEEDPITPAVPPKSIQWQRPVPSGISATGMTASTGAWAKLLVAKPTDVLPTIEKHSSSPSLSLQGGNTPGLRVNEPLSAADATYQPPWPPRQQATSASGGVATEKPFLQRGSQPMTVGAGAKPGETPGPFRHSTAPVHAITDEPGPDTKKAASALNVDLSQLPRNVFSSLERFLNDDPLISSNQDLWLRGVQLGIGHGLATLKSTILEEIEHNGLMFGRPYPLDPGQTRAEQRRAIESNNYFDRLVAKLAGDTFMSVQSQAMGLRRRHGSNAQPSAAPFARVPMTYGNPAGHVNPGSAPTPPFLPRFATHPMSAGGLIAQGPRYPQDNPSFSRPPVGPWMNPPTNATATQTYNIGDKRQPDDAVSPEFAAVPDGLPPLSTVWRGGEFPRASPQLTTTKDGRAVISISPRQE